MSILRTLPWIDEWLDAAAESWSMISEREYLALVRQWRDDYLLLIQAGRYSCKGDRALDVIAGRLPADVWLFSGVKVPTLANLGGLGAAAYHVIGLRSIQRELANRLELILVAGDFSWSCVFSYEGGSLIWERLHEQIP